MFVVPKKKHKRANKRNIIKRRMREVYRLNKQTLYDSFMNAKYDIMFVYLSTEESEYSLIEDKMKQLINQLVEKA